MVCVLENTALRSSLSHASNVLLVVSFCVALAGCHHTDDGPEMSVVMSPSGHAAMHIKCDESIDCLYGAARACPSGYALVENETYVTGHSGSVGTRANGISTHVGGSFTERTREMLIECHRGGTGEYYDPTIGGRAPALHAIVATPPAPTEEPLDCSADPLTMGNMDYAACAMKKK